MRQLKSKSNFSTPYDRPTTRGEYNNEKSLTQPNMSMNAQAILTRYSRGQSVEFNNNLQYTEEIIMPKVEDELARLDMIRQVSMEVAAHNKALKEAKEVAELERKRLAALQERQKGHTEAVQQLGEKVAQIAPKTDTSQNSGVN